MFPSNELASKAPRVGYVKGLGLQEMLDPPAALEFFRPNRERTLLKLDEGKEPVRPSLCDRYNDSRFGWRKMLPGNSPCNPQSKRCLNFPIEDGSFPCNPQSSSLSDDREEDRFIKELGTTSDMFNPLKSSSLSLVRFRTSSSKESLSKEIASRLTRS
ncbi:hypothetical protein NC653_028614 [Populus alba x Populus x berolinensis]|uniref:Uncharacterized protein n=1 Tax=Populus alba x Populus x berolinensis TaxID=444605 RepID=A0AAD6Q2A0_9ROSI|nr:hypothetical protein NC653_028614 [Populus alba x Populus x berolinensis]